MTRYWYHPESESLFTTSDAEEANAHDPLCEEIDEAAYRSIELRLLAEDDQWEFEWRSEMFADLLG